ncbi:MAG: 8-amino-7-oxononanoate synthase [Hyphomonas sp.]|uniref:aminotransferase class I/II-fold pyridoxal phosphate-dependent enzyme n=1 Tax=Hyphomonas sp. TaxID=87 RepID=UPI001DFA405A|nr:aminotransferase class I/II-fold pyridoxal phosphate-dependent enzyme [Hyphomonas sp.]MBA4227527.1 8-amino-7-oxononanoate synthase [Hyphomonas sp.]
MTSFERLKAHAEQKLAQLEASGQRRSLTETAREAGGRAARAGRRVISFCDNDYLSLSHDPRVTQAAAEAALAHGAGSGGSRLITGNHPLNSALEARLAALKGTEGARVFGSGFLANLGTIPALVGKGDTIVMDELAHACMHGGAKLSGAEIRLFRHNDVADAARLMQGAPGQVLVLTETVFSMDGDVAPLAELGALAEAAGAWLMTDDAHGLGISAQENPAQIQMGTLSKAVGGYGGYVCGPAALMDLLTSRARSFVYTTGLPPPVLAAAITALDILKAEPERAAKARRHAALFCALMGLPAPESVIVPIIIGPEAEAMRVSAALLERGYLVTAIRPPTVPAGTARLRVTFAAGHEEADVRAFAGALRDIMEQACAAIS